MCSHEFCGCLSVAAVVAARSKATTYYNDWTVFTKKIMHGFGIIPRFIHTEPKIEMQLMG